MTAGADINLGSMVVSDNTLSCVGGPQNRAKIAQLEQLVYVPIGRVFAMRYVLILTYFYILFAGMAVAQESAFIELDIRARAALENGERARVIIQFVGPSEDISESEGSDFDRRRIVFLSSTRERIIERAFDSTPSQLSIMQADGSQPHLARQFEYTPAMVMLLNRREIEVIAQDTEVIRISSDHLDAPTLDAIRVSTGVHNLHYIGIRGGGATIAILDSGVRYDHPAFADNIAGSACFSTNSPADRSISLCAGKVSSDTTSPQAAAACQDSIIWEDCNHGTHVASIATGRSGTHPQLGQYRYNGFAIAAELLPINVFSMFNDATVCDGVPRCLRSYVSDQIAALDWLYLNHARFAPLTVNMSLGSGQFSDECNTDPRAAVIRRLAELNTVVVASAGNESAATVSSPACISDVVAVGALFRGGGRILGSYGEEVNFFASGEDVDAAAITPDLSLSASFSGTSMSSPQVAGSIAMLQAAFPDRSAQDAISALGATGTPVTGGIPEITRPSIRPDLAFQSMLDAFGRTPELTFEAIDPLIFSGLRDSVSSFNSIRFRITNSGERDEHWSLTGVGRNVTFDFGDAEVLDNESLVPVYESRLRAGDSLTIEMSFGTVSGLGRDDSSGSVRFAGAGADVTFDFEINIEHYPSRNDDVNAMTQITAREFDFYYTAAIPTYQPEEPELDGYDGSVWYTWQPSEEGNYRLEGGTPISVYRAPFASFQTLQRIGEYDNSDEFVVDFHLERGTGVLIQQHHANGDYATVELKGEENLQSDLGASASNAVRLLGVSGFRDHTSPETSWVAGQQTDLYYFHRDNYVRWFIWTAPYSGNFVVSDELYFSRGQISSLAIFARTDGAHEHLATDPDSLLETLAAQSFEFIEEARLSIEIEEGRTYWIRHASQNNLFAQFTYGPVGPSDHQLVGALLPGFRSGGVGESISAFLTVINPLSYGRNAENCRIVVPYSRRDGHEVGEAVPDINYRRTDDANQAIGDANPMFNLEAGVRASFVVGFTPPVPGRFYANLFFHCDNVLPATSDFEDFASFGFAASFEPIPDIIPIAATASGDGIIELQNFRTTAFAVASVNNSNATAEIMVTPMMTNVKFYAPRDDNRIITGEICQTNPTSGVCISPRVPTLAVSYAPGEIKTFTVFVRSENMIEYFAPARLRAEVIFNDTESRGSNSTNRGSTSVAIRALGD